ncbi:acetate/propionate family kinase [Halorhodospira sp. 9621]|uniref:acetate/propionate family kinase n=1 Tax=Halorhodospira TaxID=85108 RepID=UPI001912CAF4|nr:MULTISPECIES: acetate/propionate family kinase [Halorhodospira]MBK5935631.1 acetate kinase [Halorhodospira halophila]MBK5944373.1 acetate kinase [Halorhodospira halophila]MCG5527506.1 acetate/propionate family kinase [Halorhodospira halophila]MCG5533537.1 acetate/propionate family kinase [Halorhodospira sp. 9621]MCG5538403.1 acetate/propionate family kinase [Halorhodospira sp. 9622]
MPDDAILVLNAGSSSVKYAVYRHGDEDALTLHLRGQVEGIGAAARLHVDDLQGAVATRELRAGADHDAALSAVLDAVRAHLGELNLVAAGHRIVHGGQAHSAPVVIDAAVLEALHQLEPLAPLHQPHNLAAVEAVRRVAPELPQVACFDTAFHRTQPAVAQRFALPRAYEQRGVVRYGFHGLSYEYIAARLPEYDPAAAAGRTVVAHLGAGASLCALAGGRSVATTMGFTALDGLPMGQRCGNIDPGVILHLLQQEGMTAAEVERLLYRESGLLGVSGLSADMRVLLDSDDPAAEEAVDLFCHRTLREIGGLAAVLGGLDAVVFTAGIGEHATPVRRRILEGLAWLGLELDGAANEAGGPRLTAAGSALRAWVIPTDEERVIAAHTARLAA